MTRGARPHPFHAQRAACAPVSARSPSTRSLARSSPAAPVAARPPCGMPDTRKNFRFIARRRLPNRDLYPAPHWQSRTRKVRHTHWFLASARMVSPAHTQNSKLWRELTLQEGHWAPANLSDALTPGLEVTKHGRTRRRRAMQSLGKAEENGGGGVRRRVSLPRTGVHLTRHYSQSTQRAPRAGT